MQNSCFDSSGEERRQEIDAKQKSAWDRGIDRHLKMKERNSSIICARIKSFLFETLHARIKSFLFETLLAQYFSSVSKIIRCWAVREWRLKSEDSNFLATCWIINSLHFCVKKKWRFAKWSIMANNRRELLALMQEKMRKLKYLKADIEIEDEISSKWKRNYFCNKILTGSDLTTKKTHRWNCEQSVYWLTTGNDTNNMRHF